MSQIYSKIFLFFLFFGLLFFAKSFANDAIRFDVSTSNVSLGEDFEIVVQFENSDVTQGNIQIEIPGIENFQVFSRAQSFSFENINGQMQSTLQYTIVASPKTLGKFSLGPVKIGSGSGALQDDVIREIQVGTAAKVDSQRQLGSSDTTKDAPEIAGVQVNVSLYFWMFVFGLVGFGVLGFLLLKKYFSLQEESQNLAQKEIVPVLEKSDVSHRAFFERLLAELSDLSHEEFFEALNSELRKIFGEILGVSAEHQTLAELKKEPLLKQEALFEIFQHSYMLQYQHEIDDVSKRKKLLEKILALV